MKRAFIYAALFGIAIPAAAVLAQQNTAPADAGGPALTQPCPGGGYGPGMGMAGRGLAAQLMTPEEMAAHRQAMWSAQTVEERQQLRLQQHALMVERAKAKGISLPATPPAGGRMGMGRGGRGCG